MTGFDDEFLAGVIVWIEAERYFVEYGAADLVYRRGRHTAVGCKKSDLEKYSQRAHQPLIFIAAVPVVGGYTAVHLLDDLPCPVLGKVWRAGIIEQESGVYTGLVAIVKVDLPVLGVCFYGV